MRSSSSASHPSRRKELPWYGKGSGFSSGGATTSSSSGHSHGGSGELPVYDSYTKVRTGDKRKRLSTANLQRHLETARKRGPRGMTTEFQSRSAPASQPKSKTGGRSPSKEKKPKSGEPPPPLPDLPKFWNPIPSRTPWRPIKSVSVKTDETVIGSVEKKEPPVAVEGEPAPVSSSQGMDVQLPTFSPAPLSSSGVPDPVIGEDDMPEALAPSTPILGRGSRTKSSSKKKGSGTETGSKSMDTKSSSSSGGSSGGPPSGHQPAATTQPREQSSFSLRLPFYPPPPPSWPSNEEAGGDGSGGENAVSRTTMQAGQQHLGASPAVRPFAPTQSSDSVFGHVRGGENAVSTTTMQVGQQHLGASPAVQPSAAVQSSDSEFGHVRGEGVFLTGALGSDEASAVSPTGSESTIIAPGLGSDVGGAGDGASMIPFTLPWFTTGRQRSSDFLLRYEQEARALPLHTGTTPQVQFTTGAQRFSSGPVSANVSEGQAPGIGPLPGSGRVPPPPGLGSSLGVGGGGASTTTTFHQHTGTTPMEFTASGESSGSVATPDLDNTVPGESVIYPPIQRAFGSVPGILPEVSLSHDPRRHLLDTVREDSRSPGGRILIRSIENPDSHIAQPTSTRHDSENGRPTSNTNGNSGNQDADSTGNGSSSGALRPRPLWWQRRWQ